MSTTHKIEGEQTPLPTTRAEEIAAEGPYRADWENGFSVDDVTHWQLLPTPPNPEQR